MIIEMKFRVFGSQMQQPINIRVLDAKLHIDIGMECDDKIIGFDGQFYYAKYDDETCEESYCKQKIRVYIALKQRLIKHCDITTGFHKYSIITICVIGGNTYLNNEAGYHLLDKEFRTHDPVKQITTYGLKYLRDSMMTERYLIYQRGDHRHVRYVTAVDRYQKDGDEIVLGNGDIWGGYYRDFIIISGKRWLEYCFDDGSRDIVYKISIPEYHETYYTSKGIIIQREGGEIDFIGFSNVLHVIQPGNSCESKITIQDSNRDYFTITTEHTIKIYHIEDKPIIIHEQTLDEAIDIHPAIVFNVLPIAECKKSNLTLNNMTHSDIQISCLV